MSALADRYVASKPFSFKQYTGQTNFNKDRSNLNIDTKPNVYAPGKANAGSKYAPKKLTRYNP